MDGLDFSALTDDQLVELARACCMEAIRRNPATQQAMQDMMLTEAERVRIVRAATDAEIAAGRARERERIARETAAQVRMAEEARTAQARAAAAQAAAEQARQAARQADARSMDLLRRAAALVGRLPQDIGVVHCATKRGCRVYINEGSYRYTTSHLVTYDVARASISTLAALVKHKAELIGLCAALSVHLPLDTHIAGKSFVWPQE